MLEACLRHRLRKLRTWLGRLICDIERKIAGDVVIEAQFTTVLECSRKIFEQNKPDKNKLYALHAPEGECIGKGKARTRYEFGVKASIATINEKAKGGSLWLVRKPCPAIHMMVTLWQLRLIRGSG